MFGLTKREQRWKADQRAAEALIPFATAAINAAASVRIAEAQVDAAVAAERERCAKIVDVPPGVEASDIHGGQETIDVLRDLAARIRCLT